MTQCTDALNILLVDDDAANRGLFLLMLREVKIGDRAIAISTACNGLEALRMVQYGVAETTQPQTNVSHSRSGASFDLIFMDCCMPEMDGYEATRHIRDHEQGTRRITIIGLTALILAGDRDRCFLSGMDDYLSKPTTIEDLNAVVEKWLPCICQRRS